MFAAVLYSGISFGKDIKKIYVHELIKINLKVDRQYGDNRRREREVPSKKKTPGARKVFRETKKRVSATNILDLFRAKCYNMLDYSRRHD